MNKILLAAAEIITALLHRWMCYFFASCTVENMTHQFLDSKSTTSAPYGKSGSPEEWDFRQKCVAHANCPNRPGTLIPYLQVC
jgi:hypothetical protein